MSMNRARVMRAALVAMPLLLGGCAADGSLLGKRPASIAADRVATSQFTTFEPALEAGKAAFREGSYCNAEVAFQRAVELNANSPDAWLGLAASYDRLRRFDLADRAYQAASTWLASNPVYYNNLGYSYLLRGDLPKARQNFDKARALDPQNPVVTQNLALMKAGAADL
jgi:Flp pilus assembly protein TadD